MWPIRGEPGLAERLLRVVDMQGCTLLHKGAGGVYAMVQLLFATTSVVDPNCEVVIERAPLDMVDGNENLIRFMREQLGACATRAKPRAKLLRFPRAWFQSAPGGGADACFPC